MNIEDFAIEEHYHVPNQHSDEETNHVRNEMLCNIANELHILNFLLTSIFKVASEENTVQNTDDQQTVVQAPAPTEG